MGTLSGGGSEVISIGERCLLGANAGIGISLGDDCTVEAGLYVTAGTLVTLPDGEVVKGRDLSGANGLLFRRNSRTGHGRGAAALRQLGRAQRGIARERLTSVWYSPRRTPPAAMIAAWSSAASSARRSGSSDSEMLYVPASAT